MKFDSKTRNDSLIVRPGSDSEIELFMVSLEGEDVMDDLTARNATHLLKQLDHDGYLQRICGATR